jgi:MarR family transcriptional regulator, transcriptional regulator for hemolysin
MRPEGPPIGLHLAATAKAVSRAFNATLAEAGGSLPTWLILTSLRGEQWRTQQELARALGIEGATLTRHLDALERAGLVERRRDPHDRRAVQVELTKAGEALHSRLRHNVVAFDRQLRRGLDDAELRRLRSTLRRLEQNAASHDRD